jgi:hypothetical protein
MSKLRAATVLAAAVVALLAFATPASATIDTWYRWGETEHDYYHYGNSSLGEFDTSVWVDELERDYDEDGIPDADFIRGHARNCKVRGVLRSQVDYVRLGNATQGGVLAEKLTAVNSGTAPCADSVTAWVKVADSSTCGSPFEAWVRGGFSARWSDLRLSSGVTYVGDRSGWDWCRTAPATAEKQR